MCESFPESQDFGPIILWLGSESWPDFHLGVESEFSTAFHSLVAKGTEAVLRLCAPITATKGLEVS